MLRTNLQGKVAVVTAAAGAVGREIVGAFAASGATVAVCDRDYDAAAGVAWELNEAGGEAAGFELDIRNKDAAGKVCAAIAERFGRIDILVNNENETVGPKERKPLHEFDDRLFDELLLVGAYGLYYFSKAVMREMAKNGGGAVVNVTSILGMVPAANLTPAVAVSGGTIGFTRMWGEELSDANIRVNAVAAGIGAAENDRESADAGNATAGDAVAGAEATGKLTHLGVKRLTRPEDIANAVLFLASDEASYITGAVLPVDGGLNAGYVRSF